MRLRKLHLRAFGPFTDRVLDFGEGAHSLILVRGPNEAGKSSALRAISALRFGIPTQSKDDFVHSHPNMRIGGEFIDRDGKQYSLMRRKGRSATLHLADFLNPGSAVDQPAPPEIEALLTCGLTKEQHDSMFGIDHQSLRAGGEALLNGEGEVGAALFEASAGVRSVPEILDRLDGSARKYFMPGARGRNAKINEALAAYELHHTAFRQAQVRPGTWTDLFKKQQNASDEVSALGRRWQEVHGQLLLIGELRAVAPLLASLDTATAALVELSAAPLLSASAAQDRSAAETGLADARHNAGIAAAEKDRQIHRLNGLTVDEAILSIGAAVRRFAGSAEAIDRHQRDIADAQVDEESHSRAMSLLAANIAPELELSDVLGRSPSRVKRAEIERLLRGAEQAQRALEQHRASAILAPEAQETAAIELPTAEARAALRVAQAQVARSDADLKRVSALPIEIKAARRGVGQALSTAGLVDEAAFSRVRPLLNAQIDAARNNQSENATRRAGYLKRIQEVTDAMATTAEQRDRLLSDGAVPTRDEVAVARGLRDASWALVRDTYIDGTPPISAAQSEVKPLPKVYEETVHEADRLVDALAVDTKRAAELQACTDNLRALERDRAELNANLADVTNTEAEQDRVWSQLLESGTLPALSPAALRDWQALLPAVRTALENLQSKLDEWDRVQQVETTLTTQLRVALVGTGHVSPSSTETLPTLIAVADDIERQLKQLETAIERATGAEITQNRQARQWASRDVVLLALQQAAAASLQPALADLLLSDDASDEVARARLVEFEQLNELNTQLLAAQTSKTRAEQALTQIANAANTIWESLGDAPATDLRTYSEQVAARLDDAEQAQAERTMAQQAADAALRSLSGHEATAQRHSDAIASLCQAASVETANQLLEAEESSTRKREAQESVDKTRRQLAAASKRTVLELRELILDRDAARMDADEMSLTEEQSRLEKELIEAREREEIARADLAAIDGSDVAAETREAMERAASSVRTNMAPWIRSKIAHSLLAEALKRFRDRAQGPMLTAASKYLERMTRGRFVRLVSDDSGKAPALVALRGNGTRVHVDGMSEGTRDQLYLALRLAALDFRRKAGIDLPVILDDILITSDEDRSAAILEALSDAAHAHQVVVFTHHNHIADIAVQCLSAQVLRLVTLE